MIVKVQEKENVPYTTDVNDLLYKHQQRFESILIQDLNSFGSHCKLREACEYALMNGGRRFRPALVFMVAEALGNDLNPFNAALSIEYFHTASLIADDLPCMDDDDFRRNKPSLHKVFGETTALLASYALIAAGNARIADCAHYMNQFSHPLGVNSYYLGALALENAASNTGIQGTTGGQFLDIFPPELSLEVLREVIQKKTVSLFEVAFIFGWLFGGGHPDQLPFIKQAATHFGMAFQIIDDFGDMKQDIVNNRKINMVNVFGVDKASQMFHEEITGYRKVLTHLKVGSSDLLGIAGCLEEQLKVYFHLNHHSPI